MLYQRLAKQTIGPKQPTDCFCSTHVPRMMFTFLNGWLGGGVFFDPYKLYEV